jgi:hypothetical protein
MYYLYLNLDLHLIVVSSFATFDTRKYMMEREIVFAYADDFNFAYIDTDLHRTEQHRDE